MSSGGEWVLIGSDRYFFLKKTHKNPKELIRTHQNPSHQPTTPPLRLPKLPNLLNLPKGCAPSALSLLEKYFAFYLQIVEMFSNFARIFADDAITLNYINN